MAAQADLRQQLAAARWGPLGALGMLTMHMRCPKTMPRWKTT